MSPRFRRLAFITLFFVAILAGLRLAAGVAIPAIVSVLAALALDPAVQLLQRVVRSRAVASAVVVAGVVLLLGASAYALSDDVVATARRLPEATERLRTALRELHRGDGPLGALGKAADDIEAAASEVAGRKPVPPARAETWTGLGLRDWLVVGSMSVIGFAGQFVLLVFFVYFLLASGDLFKRKLVRVFGPGLAARRVTVEVLDGIHSAIRRFVLVVLTTNVLVGLTSYAAFRAVGLENAGVWGVVAGALNTIPYAGGAVVTALVFLVSFLQFDRLDLAALTAGLALVITSLEGLLLTPWWMGRTGRLNNPAVFAGLLFWGWLWGAWGVLLAYPILMVMKTIATHVEDLAPVGELLGE
jgi:predicted PurR-regulated permease PerM